MFQVNRNVYWTTATYQGQFAEDHITFKSMASSDGKLRVPTAGYGQNGNRGCYYNWFINVDGGDYTQYTGTGSTSNNLVVAEGLTANSEHIVDIRIFDIEDAYGRARAFGWYQSGIADRLIEIIVDSTYLGFANSAEDTGNYFRFRQYQGCSNLINAYNEFIPATCRDTGTWFRCHQYEGCTSLLVAGVESCPNSITEIKGGFREYQYAYCYNLVQPAAEVMPNTVTSIGDHFRGWEYLDCRSITNGAQEVLPPALEYIYSYFRCSQYQGCTNLTTASDEVMPNTVKHILTEFRLNQYNGCSNLEYAAHEAISNQLLYEGYWIHFRHTQYANCPKLKEAYIVSMPMTFTGGNNYCRAGSFQNAGGQSGGVTFYFSGPKVESGDSSPAYGCTVKALYVPMELLDAYKNSYWSSWRDRTYGY